MTNPEETLPPGFRFHPTDEELILHYLRNRAASNPCSVSIMADVHIYKFDPWDLPGKAIFGDKEWYFFSLRDRKYPNGLRPNRATASGYWKATGTDKPIFSTSGGGRKESIGVKKILVFYEGKPPRGVKTNWIMHEYRLTPSAKLSSGEIDHHHQQQRQLQNRSSTASMRLDDWVLCRIYQKRNNSNQNLSTPSTSVGQKRGDSTIDDTNYLSTFPDVITNHNINLPNLAGSLSELLEDNNYFMLSRFFHDNPSSEISGQKQQIGTSLFPMPAIATSLQKTHLSVEGNGNTIRTEDGFFEVKGGGGGYSLLQPSKKYNTSSSFTSTDLSSSMIETPDQCSSSYLSHQMLLNSLTLDFIDFTG